MAEFDNSNPVVDSLWKLADLLQKEKLAETKHTQSPKLQQSVVVDPKTGKSVMAIFDPNTGQYSPTAMEHGYAPRVDPLTGYVIPSSKAQEQGTQYYENPPTQTQPGPATPVQRKQLQDIEKRVEQSGVSQAVPSMQRAEETIPGLYTGEPKFKSVGGWKSLVPDLVVPLAEKVHILPQGSQKERAAIQDVLNTKIYDSSGKQINESEMKRIVKAMGLQGVTDPEAIKDAFRQSGHVVMEKQKQITAGQDPSAIQMYKQKGGRAGYESLGEMLQPQGQSQQANPSSFNSNKKAIKTLRNRRTGQIKVIYDDGSEEIQ